VRIATRYRKAAAIILQDELDSRVTDTAPLRSAVKQRYPDRPRANLQPVSSYQPPAWDERMRGRGAATDPEFLLFQLILAGLRAHSADHRGAVPLLASAVVGWCVRQSFGARRDSSWPTCWPEEPGQPRSRPRLSDKRDRDATSSCPSATHQVSARNLQELNLSRDFSGVSVYGRVPPKATAQLEPPGQYAARQHDARTSCRARIHHEGPPPNPILTIGLREGLRLEQITARLEKLHIPTRGSQMTRWTSTTW